VLALPQEHKASLVRREFGELQQGLVRSGNASPNIQFQVAVQVAMQTSKENILVPHLKIA